MKQKYNQVFRNIEMKILASVNRLLYLLLITGLSISALLQTVSNEIDAAEISTTDKEISKNRMVDVSEKQNSITATTVDDTEYVNPHWDKTQCNTCHDSEIDIKGSNTNLITDKTKCLHCHQEDVIHKYIHPTGIELPKEYSDRMQSVWKNNLHLSKDRLLTCVTCHDLLDQCLPGRSYMSELNPMFLRGGPYSNRFGICYVCHDSSKYKAMSSHDQIDANGFLILSKCRLCHAVNEKDRIKKGIKRDKSKYPILKKLDSDRTLICLRCHKKIDHPTTAFKVVSINKYRHFVKITEEKNKTLKEMIEKTGSALPLEPQTDRIYCATCHEPHQIGVFEGDEQKKKDGIRNRLRAQKICIYCHDK